MKQILLSEIQHTKQSCKHPAFCFLILCHVSLSFSTFLHVLFFSSLIVSFPIRFSVLWMSKATLWKWSDPFKSPQVNVTSVNMSALALSQFNTPITRRETVGCGRLSLAPLRSQLFHFTCWLNVAVLWPWEMEAPPRRNKKYILHRQIKALHKKKRKKKVSISKALQYESLLKHYNVCNIYNKMVGYLN